MKKFVIALCTVFLLTSCAGLTPKKVADFTLPVLHGKLLYEEFEEAALAVLSLPWNEDEKPVIAAIVNELNQDRERIGKLHEQGGAQMVMSALQAENDIRRIGETYLRGREMVINLIARTGARPPPQLTVADKSAVAAYNGAMQFIRSAQQQGKTVNGQEIITYLGIGLRLFAATKGIVIPASI